MGHSKGSVSKVDVTPDCVVGDCSSSPVLSREHHMCNKDSTHSSGVFKKTTDFGRLLLYKCQQRSNNIKDMITLPGHVRVLLVSSISL